MANRSEGQLEIAVGAVSIAFLALMELAICLFLLLYILPRTDGWVSFATWNGVLFFGSAGLLMVVYLMPKRRVATFARAGDVYRFVQPRVVSVVRAIIGLYAAVILPFVALFLIFAIPGMLFVEPASVFPALTRLDLWTVYQSIDNFSGLFFILIPLLLAFPWLYPKYLRLVGDMLRDLFMESGLQIDPEGIRVLGARAAFVPWSWVERVGVVVHGYADTLVLYGLPALDALRVQLDPRLPKSVREQVEFSGEGLPIKFDYLPVRPKEVEDLIRSRFLR